MSVFHDIHHNSIGAAMKMFTFLLLLPTIGVYATYTTKYDQPFKFDCKPGQSIWLVRSEHNNKVEDRVWDIRCRPNPGITNTCSWTPYVNTWDETFDFKCTFNSVISGISSYHYNKAEDRRFKFKCCMPNKVLRSCKQTPWLNSWDQDLFYYVPFDQHLVGMKSYHLNKAEDRRFSFYTCKQ